MLILIISGSQKEGTYVVGWVHYGIVHYVNEVYLVCILIQYQLSQQSKEGSRYTIVHEAAIM